MDAIDSILRRLDMIERRLDEANRLGPPRVYRASVTTTDATTTTIYTFSTVTNTVYEFDIILIGIRTDVSGNTNAYRFLFKAENIGGTIVRSGMTDSGGDTAIWQAEDDASWNVQSAQSGTNVLIQVIGAAGQTINWSMRATVEQQA